MQNTTINWPAIIKHANDDELVYISDNTEWSSDTELQTVVYDEDDYLLDSSGQIFTLKNNSNGGVIAQPTQQIKPLLDVLGLVKAHAAQSGSCCVAKLYAPGIAEAFAIVKSMNND